MGGRQERTEIKTMHLQHHWYLVAGKMNNDSVWTATALREKPKEEGGRKDQQL